MEFRKKLQKPTGEWVYVEPPLAALEIGEDRLFLAGVAVSGKGAENGLCKRLIAAHDPIPTCVDPRLRFPECNIDAMGGREPPR